MARRAAARRRRDLDIADRQDITNGTRGCQVVLGSGAARIARAHNRNHVQRRVNTAEQELRQARKAEIEARKFRNHMRDMLLLFKGEPSTSPFCTWVNDPRESEELPPHWRPPPVPPVPDDPPF
ncbi:hypothetical protein B1T48_24665 [Mycobacterium persicum]|nr:hypothetical protein B1T48_24665 [Mycobacterium persicum]